jgi:hypothetical protein
MSDAKWDHQRISVSALPGNISKKWEKTESNSIKQYNE